MDRFKENVNLIANGVTITTFVFAIILKMNGIPVAVFLDAVNTHTTMLSDLQVLYFPVFLILFLLIQVFFSWFYSLSLAGLSRRDGGVMGLITFITSFITAWSMIIFIQLLFTGRNTDGNDMMFNGMKIYLPVLSLMIVISLIIFLYILKTVMTRNNIGDRFGGLAVKLTGSYSILYLYLLVRNFMPPVS